MWKIKFQKAEILIIVFIVLGSFFIISRYRNLADDFQQYGSEVIANHQAILRSQTQWRLPENGEVNNSLRFYFFGDLMLDRHVGERLAGKPLSTLFSSFEGGNKFWSGADIVGANLEGAVTDNGAHYAPQNAYDFAFAPERIAELQAYGFNYFSSANNHFSDQGQNGVEETRKNLSELGFYYSGSTDAKVDEYSRKDIIVSGQKIAMIGLSMVYNNFDLEAAEKLIGTASLETNLVIVNIHWGTEYEHQFNKHQQAIGHALIDTGADAIIGHHPHVVQGVEIYQGKPIFYSLGNFIFDQYFSADTQEGLSVGLDFSQASTTISFYPLKSAKAAPRLMDENEKVKFWEKFIAWSQLDANQKAAIESGRLVLERKNNQ
ncbi:MAG: CapA family protein [Candidatus Falkowbacteria bacterium]|nr:MAG: CapA family protein [Candidatus Falkowbacteria bacterium]